MCKRIFNIGTIDKIIANRISLIFTFLVLAAASKAQPFYIFSYTYQNVTRANGGGTLEPGDVIEVRALMKIDKPATRLRYIADIPAGLQYIANSMKIVTNEGLLFDGTYTDADNDDKGVYIGIPPEKLRINIGTGAANATVAGYGSPLGGGSVNPGDKPKFYGTTLLVVAYRLTVTAAFGDTIFPKGTFLFRKNDGVDTTANLAYSGIRVISNQALCNDFSGASFSAESSFGQGTIQNRVAGVNAPGYNKVDLVLNNPGDGNYSVVNNTSADAWTDNTGPYKPLVNSHRVFNGFWDIIGDHTGASDPILGNPPTATGDKGGYMLVVNAAFPTGEAYNDLITNVCPNTNYEFSAWLRNICGVCGIDADSKATYTPGVLPNLAFTINDVDYYNTGTLPWNEKWEKRGFIYQTGPLESSFKITIKNNAAGGGGNDWVMDDINLATCYPNLTMSPTDTAKVCVGGIVNLYDTVRSFFNNYNYYCWEKSVDGGVTWISTGNCSSKTPVLKNGLWEYIVDTAFVTVVADSGVNYRVKVATTYANLSDVNCSVDNSQKVFLKVYNYDCSVLDGVLKEFSGRLENEQAVLTWSTQNESGVKSFEVQRSKDGVHFTTIQNVAPLYLSGGNYKVQDNEQVIGSIFYRIRINGQSESQAKYSNAISLYQLNSTFDIRVNNPFANNLKFELAATSSGLLEVLLYDSYGRVVRKKNFKVSKGSNSLVLDDVSPLKPGVYILSGSMNSHSVQHKIMKVH